MALRSRFRSRHFFTGVSLKAWSRRASITLLFWPEAEAAEMIRKSLPGLIVPVIMSLSIGAILITWPLLKQKYMEEASADVLWFEKECVTPASSIENMSYSRVHISGSEVELQRIREVINKIVGEELPEGTETVAFFEYDDDEGTSFLATFDSNGCSIFTTFVDSRIVPFVMVPLKVNDYWSDLKPGA
jgi:hypothetical protein